MKIITLGQVAIACYTEAEYRLGEFVFPSSSSVIYEGFPKRLTEKVAMKFAPLHPNFMRYYQDALMTLWKGRKQFSKGTEDPVRAVNSYLPKWTAFITVWRAIEVTDS